MPFTPFITAAKKSPAKVEKINIKKSGRKISLGRPGAERQNPGRPRDSEWVLNLTLKRHETCM